MLKEERKEIKEKINKKTEKELWEAYLDYQRILYNPEYLLEEWLEKRTPFVPNLVKIGNLAYLDIIEEIEQERKKQGI